MNNHSSHFPIFSISSPSNKRGKLTSSVAAADVTMQKVSLSGDHQGGIGAGSTPMSRFSARDAHTIAMLTAALLGQS
jgi:hypothetical protein